MYLNLKGKGLFVFSDPAAAKSVLAFIKLNKQFNEILVISDREYDFYVDFGLLVTLYSKNSIEKIFKKFKPSFLFTGTSVNSSLEIFFIAYAQKNSIPSYSFIDHYTRFTDRFRLKKKLIFPDNICVLDQEGEKIAVENNFNGRIIITGNLYLQYLKIWRPIESRDKFMLKNGIARKHKLITYAPDPISNIGVGGKGEYGLDEITVWNEIYNVLRRVDGNLFTFVLIVHPNQQSSKLEEMVLNSSIKNVLIAKKIHTTSLLYFSDVVIGIFSNILREALLLDTSIIRVLKGLKVPDPFDHLNVGIKITERHHLENEILKNIC